MKICPGCGSPIEEENALFCPECGIKLTGVSEDTEPINIENIPERKENNLQETMSGLGNSARNLFDNLAESSGKAVSTMKENYDRTVQEAGKNNIVLADGEVIIREYEVLKMHLPPARGRLIVTNKRILFYSGSVYRKAMSSVPIDTVGSISMYNGMALSVIAMLGCAVMVYLFAVCLGARHMQGYALLCFVLAVVCAYLALRRTMFLHIASVNSSTGLMIGRPNLFGASLYAVGGRAGADAEAVMNELGAIVLDLKQDSEKAVEKWKRS